MTDHSILTHHLSTGFTQMDESVMLLNASPVGGILRNAHSLMGQSKNAESIARLKIFFVKVFVL
jgi:hypothetical protein